MRSDAKLLSLRVETLPLQHAIRFGALSFRHQFGFEALTLRVEQRTHPLAFGIQVGGRALSLGVEQSDATMPFGFDFLIRLFADSHRRKRRRLFGLGAKTRGHLPGCLRDCLRGRLFRFGSHSCCLLRRCLLRFGSYRCHLLR